MDDFFKTVIAETPDRELVLSRVFDAPKVLLWKVWTDPKHVQSWFGPKGFTNPVCEIDFKVGGSYKYVMRSPEGIDYPVQGKFLEIVEHQKIVSTDIVEEHPTEWFETLNEYIGNTEEEKSPDSVVTVLFEEIQNRTKLTIRTVFASNQVRDAMMKMGMREGWTESLERFLAELSRA
ncbi:SRPBCC domain-containing protein [Leptospira idonii]|uniref:Activator of Hsp90 ATPase homologue 1/2-like C-terminal domain-containing protein n=1 Tax=Leptospira idonii TaxID=1193500 RepID=A0A4R9M1S9_9LEPT|nr:SRPBCC domain-containing protein [Leptospira idonii]TGN20032.1 hypothetical protein EHS15_04860 [Leptospira idonii]